MESEQVMYAVISNSILAKSVTLNDVYTFDEYYNAGYEYGILEIKAAKGEASISDLIDQLSFAIETIEIHDLVFDDKTGEYADVVITTYDKYHTLDKVMCTFDTVARKMVNVIQIV